MKAQHTSTLLSLRPCIGVQQCFTGLTIQKYSALSHSPRGVSNKNCFLMKLQTLLFMLCFFCFLFFIFQAECRLFIQFQRYVLHRSFFNLVLQKCALNRWLRLRSPMAFHIHILFICTLLETEFLLLVSNETRYCSNHSSSHSTYNSSYCSLRTLIFFATVWSWALSFCKNEGRVYILYV